MVDPAAPADDPSIPVTATIRDEVRDALALMDFAIETGLRKPDGRSLAPDIVSVMKITATKVGLDDTRSEMQLRASDWARFELSYYALAEFTSPVTADTLRDTETKGDALLKPSSAQRFARLLWVIAGLFIVAVLVAGHVVVVDAEIDPPSSRLLLAKLLTPWAYGGLGACAYLLRSAHVHFYQRSFDVRRKPEYLNRILLGAISGGAVIVLVNQLTDQSGAQITVSAAALGFIAGYNTDFLFNAVERIVAAILPKVGLESIQRASPASARPSLAILEAGMTLKELMDRMEKAQGDDKELYRSLIVKLRDRV